MDCSFVPDPVSDARVPVACASVGCGAGSHGLIVSGLTFAGVASFFFVIFRSLVKKMKVVAFLRWRGEAASLLRS